MGWWSHSTCSAWRTSLRLWKDQGLRLVRGQLGQQIVARPGQEPPSWLIYVDFDNHICHLGRGLLTVELGRQSAEVAQVLALDLALQCLDRDAPTQVEKIPRVRSIFDVVHPGHGSP